jgi:hypothetical protein
MKHSKGGVSEGFGSSPSIFNSLHDDEGLKVPGNYSYDVYEEILFEMLGDELPPRFSYRTEALLPRFANEGRA